MSCGCVYVIERPATGGSQTLTYNGSTKNLSISGGNTVNVTETQDLTFNTLTGDLTISDGIGSAYSVVNVRTVGTYDYAYWSITFDTTTGHFTVNLKDLYLTNSYGTVYYLIPFISEPFINKTFSAYYNTNSVYIIEISYDFTKPSSIKLYGRFSAATATPAVNSVFSFCASSKIKDLTHIGVGEYNPSVNVFINAAGKYVVGNFNSDGAIGTTNSLFYLQYAFANSMNSTSSNFNILITEVSTGTDIYTSPSIAFPGSTSNDNVQLINNEVLVIPSGILSPNTDYTIRFYLTATVISGVLTFTHLFYNFSMG